jgi:hypothetical protein
MWVKAAAILIVQMGTWQVLVPVVCPVSAMLVSSSSSP